MAALLTIGEFSRLTFLSVKALRHYHDVGLLDPVVVDSSTGYRSYATTQVATAQLIRRLRDLDMPLDAVHSVVAADDDSQRDGLILTHLDELEAQLLRTQRSIDALRSLLRTPGSSDTTYRDEPARVAVMRRATVALLDSEEWVRSALVALLRTLRDLGIDSVGPPGALFPSALFEDGQAEVTAFVAVDAADIVHCDGLDVLDLPATRVAVLMHHGPYAQICHTYGVLGSQVADRNEGACGPSREYFVVTPAHTTDAEEFRTEVCWPVLAQPVGCAR